MAFTYQIVTATIYPYSQIVLRNIGYNQSLVGVILALGQLASCLVPLFISNIADKTGKTKFLYLITASLVVIAHATFINVPLLPVVIAFFIIAYGCAGCMTSLSDTMINLSVANTKTSYSSVRATGTFSYVIALTLFTIFQFPNNESNQQILLAMLVATSFLLLAISITPNPVHVVKTTERKGKFFDPKWFDKSFYLLSIIIFFKNIGCSVVEKLLGSYMTEVLNLGSKFTIFVALGAFTEFLFMLYFGRLLKQGKIKEFTLIVLSCIGLICRLLLYVTSTSIIVFTIAQLFHCLTYASSHIAMISYIQKHVSKEHTTLATAIYSAVDMAFAQFLGALGAGFIIDYLGYNALFEIYAIFPTIALILCFAFKNIRSDI